MMLGTYAVFGVVLFTFGCASRTPYNCTSNDQCVSHNTAGVCEGTGFCSFPDPSCDGGRRYEDHAGDGLAGQCLPAACGGIGATCCEGESGAACIGGAACIAGTCQACVADLALGRRFSCRLHTDSTIACSGDNGRGQLGIGVAGMPQPDAAGVRDSTGAVVGDAITVAAGYEQACAIRTGGTVWCWGANNGGKLGVGDTADRGVATQVIDTNDKPLANIVQLALGDDSSCVRDADGGAWCWGDNGGGQLGDGTTTARPKAAQVLVAAAGAPFTGITNLVSGARHVCAQKGDDVWCWGDNHNGPVGDGTTMSRSSPVKVYSSSQIALGRWHTCALEADGTISCWGWTGHGRLGQGKDSSFGGGNQLTPVKVLTALGGAPFTGVAQVIAGGVSCALMQDKTVQCWGDDQYGQTGTGAGAVVPAQVKYNDGTPLTDVMRVWSRNANACATRASGEIVCWGRNTEGTLGDSTLLDRGTPEPLKADCK